MRIETEKGTIINSKDVRYYKWADADGGESMIGTDKDWHLTAFFNKRKSISLASFKQEHGVKRYGNNKLTAARSWFKYALIHDMSFISFMRNDNDN